MSMRYHTKDGNMVWGYRGKHLYLRGPKLKYNNVISKNNLSIIMWFIQWVILIIAQYLSPDHEYSYSPNI